MAPFVKLRGLDRGNQGSNTGAFIARGFRVKSGLGQAAVGGTSAPGVLTTALAGANNDLTYTSKFNGVVANKINVEYLDPSANNAVLSVKVRYTAAGNPVVSVSLATGVAGAITSTAALIAAAVTAHVGASQLVSVANAAANDGTGVVIALAATPLATGANGTGVLQDMYFSVSSDATILVDVGDAPTQKMLRRNAGRYISLGEV